MLMFLNVCFYFFHKSNGEIVTSENLCTDTIVGVYARATLNFNYFAPFHL